MERKIGEIFEYKGEWYQCVEGGTCSECSFIHIDCCISNIGDCTDKRTDGVRVIFKKLEKVGEPFALYIHGDNRSVIMQEYKAYDNNIDSTSGVLMYVTDYKYKKVAIEIKQKKEDMEEKKIRLKQEDIDYLRRKFKEITQDYIIQGCDKEKVQFEFGKLFEPVQDVENEEKKLNLKPFDLEAARSGKPVCTRDGRKARIICFDRNDLYPIVALIECEEGKEMVGAYSNEGVKWGAEWMLEHQWISVEEALPDSPENILLVYVEIDSAGHKANSILMSNYVFEKFGCESSHIRVLAWMPIPKFKKGGHQ